MAVARVLVCLSPRVVLLTVRRGANLSVNAEVHRVASAILRILLDQHKPFVFSQRTYHKQEQGYFYLFIYGME